MVLNKDERFMLFKYKYKFIELIIMGVEIIVILLYCCEVIYLLLLIFNSIIINCLWML